MRHGGQGESLVPRYTRGSVSLSLSLSDEPLSLFAFNFNLRLYNVDAGVTASDIEDGDLTAAVAAYGKAWLICSSSSSTRVSNPRFVSYMTSYDAASNICQALAYGVGAVDTSKPTAFPFVITYNVKDRGKPQLAAREVRRRVFVLNPCAGKAADGGDEILCEGSGKCSTNLNCLELAEEVVVVVDLPPVVTLKGPVTLEIAQYTGYVQCPVDQDVPVSALCDRGATAKDDKDGDLTDFILACGEKYTDNGIAGCNVDTNKEGTYVITYTVSDSAGTPNAAAVTRTIVVTKNCKPPTFICLDQQSCSDPDKGNVCTADLAVAVVEEEAVDEAPVMTLRKADFLNKFVAVKQFQPYEWLGLPDILPATSSNALFIYPCLLS